MPEFNPVQTNQMPRREKLIQRLWELFRPVFFGVSPWFARRWRLGVLRYIVKMGGGMKILHNTASLARKCRVDYPWRLSMGEQSSLADGAWVYCLNEITIGNRVCIGEDVRLLTGSHSLTSPTYASLELIRLSAVMQFTKNRLSPSSIPDASIISCSV